MIVHPRKNILTTSKRDPANPVITSFNQRLPLYCYHYRTASILRSVIIVFNRMVHSICRRRQDEVGPLLPLTSAITKWVLNPLKIAPFQILGKNPGQKAAAESAPKTEMFRLAASMNLP